MVDVARDGGFTKFEVVPGGGAKAGIIDRSIVRIYVGWMTTVLLSYERLENSDEFPYTIQANDIVPGMWPMMYSRFTVPYCHSGKIIGS